MIYVPYNNELKEVIEVYVGNTPISEMYRKNDLIYQNMLQICFSNGFWVDEFPWDDNSYWMD